MAKKTFAEKMWAVQRKKIADSKKDSVVINDKTFFYDCTRKHEHGGECLTDAMINELSKIVYSNDAE